MRDRTGDTSTAAPCFISPKPTGGRARGRVYPREVPGIRAQGKCQREPISRRNPKNEIFGIARAQIIKKHQKTAIKTKKYQKTETKIKREF